VTGGGTSAAPECHLPDLEYEGRRITTIVTLPIVSHDLTDIGTRGVQVEVDPETAEGMGAFPELVDEGTDDGE
jgi:hypothetical protein